VSATSYPGYETGAAAFRHLFRSEISACSAYELTVLATAGILGDRLREAVPAQFVKGAFPLDTGVELFRINGLLRFHRGRAPAPTAAAA
jgi:hypothetical protein